MKQEKHWRQQSLASLENHDWGDPETAPTALIKRCMELSKIPVADFILGDPRVMIGQQFGLEYLVPLALEKMQGNIFVKAELYPSRLTGKLAAHRYLILGKPPTPLDRSAYPATRQKATTHRYETEHGKI